MTFKSRLPLTLLFLLRWPTRLVTSHILKDEDAGEVRRIASDAKHS